MAGMARMSRRCVSVSVAVLLLATTVRTSPTGIPPPTVTSITPATGSTAGGTSVTLTGTNFTISYFAPGFSPKVVGATVTIGGASATNVVVVSATSITATTPAGTVGAKDVVVTTGSGSGTLTNGFTYITDCLLYTSPSPRD